MGIHEIVPVSPMEKINKEEINVRKGILMHLKFGKENAIKSHELAKLIGLDKTATNQKIRKICKELLVEDHVPILSCKNGFFKAETHQEIEDYVLNLNMRIAGIKRDIDALQKIVYRIAGAEVK